MKTLVATTMLAASALINAHAQVIATLPNKAGGEIKLTREKCASAPGHLAYSTSSNNNMMLGCWLMVDSDIVIKYQGGELKAYPLMSFELRDKPQSKSEGRRDL